LLDDEAVPLKPETLSCGAARFTPGRTALSGRRACSSWANGKFEPGLARKQAEHDAHVKTVVTA
jgi:hypothetical protein